MKTPRYLLGLIFVLSLPLTVLCRSKTPENFCITKAFTTPGKIEFDLFGPAELLDFYENAIFDNNLYATWADNSEALAPDFGASMKFRHGIIKHKHGKPDVEFCKILTLFSPTPNGDIAQFSLTVNPTNPSNIVISGNYLTADEPLPENQIQNIRAVTFDNGKNWNVGRVDNINGYPVSDGDLHSLFDDFGNCWLISLTGQPPTFFPNDVSIAVSFDGGITFNLVQTFLSDPNAQFGYDYPKLAFGGDGNGGFALYFTVDFIDDFGNYTPNIGFIPVTGNGPAGIGAVSLVPLTQFTNIFDIGVPKVSKDGKIFVLGFPDTPPNFDFTPAQLIFNPGGLGNITDGSFTGPFNVAATNFYHSPNTPGCTINFVPTRGALPAPPRSLIYDDVIGRLYALYGFIESPSLQNMDIFLVFSDDDGQSWQGPIKINDCNKQNRAFQSMARDPKTGNFFFTWYDCRNDPTSASGQYFGALIEGACLPEKCPQLQTKPTKPSAVSTGQKANLGMQPLNKEYVNTRRARGLRGKLASKELVKKPIAQK